MKKAPAAPFFIGFPQGPLENATTPEKVYSCALTSQGSSVLFFSDVFQHFVQGVAHLLLPESDLQEIHDLIVGQ